MQVEPYNAAMIRRFLEHLAADLRLMDFVARAACHYPHPELVDALDRYGERCGAPMLLDRAYLDQGDTAPGEFERARALFRATLGRRYAQALQALETLGPLLDEVLTCIERGHVYDPEWMQRPLTVADVIAAQDQK